MLLQQYLSQTHKSITLIKRLLYNKDKGYDNIDFSKITRAKISSQYMEGKCKPRMF